MSHRALPWAVSVSASLFVLTVSSLPILLGTPVILWGARAALVLSIFLFTFAFLDRIREVESQRIFEYERCRVLFEQSRVGIVIFSMQCGVAEVNQAVLELTGWTRGQLEGMPCSELFFLPEDGGVDASTIYPSLVARIHAAAEQPTALMIKSANQGSIPVMASMVRIQIHGVKRAWALMVWDVRPQLEMEGALARRREQAEGLAAIGREIAAFPEQVDGLDRILDRARALFEMDLVAWGTLEDHSRQVTWHAATGAGAFRLQGASLMADEGLIGRILLDGRPYITNHLTAEHAGTPAYDLFAQPALQTGMAVPYRLREGIQGILLCASTRQVPLTDEDVMLFSHLGGFLATAAENLHLVSEVRHMATLEERQRLAGEMHDGFGQTLTYLGIRLHMIGKAAERGDTGAIRTEVADLKGVLQEAHQGVRASIFQLKESAPSRTPLPDRWSQLLDDFGQKTGIQVNYRMPPDRPLHLPQAVEAQLTRILQEALANVRNHSGARSVAVRLQTNEKQLDLTITDDGCGFAPALVEANGRHHFGLTLMQERATAIGGKLEIRSARGAGTTISLQTPLFRREESPYAIR